MIYTVTIDDDCYTLPANSSIISTSQILTSVPFNCLKGRCGRCLVKVVSGDMGKVGEVEKSFLKLMGLSQLEYRLLCQASINSDCKVKLFKG